MPTPTAPPSPKVLVIEDESRLRDLLVRAIGQMGFDAAGARSAEEAMRILDGEAHDIALLDLNLPGMSGLEFFRVVRDRWPAMQAIVLTGFGDLDAAKEAIRLEVVDFLTKPCPLGELEVALDRARKRLPQPTPPTPQVPADAIVEDSPGPPTLDDVERQHILAALDRNHGNRAATAAELGISLRTLYYRLTEYERLGYRVRGD